MAALLADQIATVLIIDSHPLMRSGLSKLLRDSEHFKPVAEAESGFKGVHLASLFTPDLILLELNLKGGMNGIETIEALRKIGIAGRIIIFADSERPSDIIASIRAGADDYVNKGIEPQDLVMRLQNILSGEAGISLEFRELIDKALRDINFQAFRRIDDLTDRELSILIHLSKGHSNKIISKELQIAENTVKVFVHRLLKKFHFASRVEMAVWALAQKIERSIKDEW